MEKFTFCAVSCKLGLPILITIDYPLLGWIFPIKEGDWKFVSYSKHFRGFPKTFECQMTVYKLLVNLRGGTYISVPIE